MQTFDEVRDFIRLSQVGRGTAIPTPFGTRLLHYADLTATGRALDFVEAFVGRLRPVYANTHTAVSTTGRTMNGLREQAREAIARSTGAGPDDVVLFTGSGATAAVNKLVGLLALRVPQPLEKALRQDAFPSGRPVILVGPYEHHSNELPWVETLAEVVEVALDSRGRIDVADLAAKAERFKGRPLVAGAISAASNVTGLLTDVPAAARALHRAGALAFVDYAAAGPYVPIEMHPADFDARLDAVFLSTHKFAGGPEGSGVLIAHKDLFRSRVPERPGGGTVEFVGGPSRDEVDYSTRLAEREEGGTPDIVGDIRAGLAFLVKELAGAGRIREHEEALAAKALERLARHPKITIMGPGPEVARLPIISFNVDGLHHDLVSALLDHLFGIQNRAGCSCAGPYGHRLLGIDHERSERLRRQIGLGLGGIKPGWVRISLPWYGSDADHEFVLQSVELIASRGEAFVPAYRFGWRDGVWRHCESEVADASPVRLTAADLLSLAPPEPEIPSDAELERLRAGYLREAARLADELEARWRREPPKWNVPTGRPDLDALVYFRYVGTEGV